MQTKEELEKKAKQLFFDSKEGILELAKKNPTNEEAHAGMCEKEYIELRALELKAHFNIGLYDFSYAMQRSGSWFGLASKKKQESKTNTVQMDYLTCLRLEMLTFGYIKREFAMSRKLVAEAKEAGIKFGPLNFKDEPYYFDK